MVCVGLSPGVSGGGRGGGRGAVKLLMLQRIGRHAKLPWALQGQRKHGLGKHSMLESMWREGGGLRKMGKHTWYAGRGRMVAIGLIGMDCVDGTAYVDCPGGAV